MSTTKPGFTWKIAIPSVSACLCVVGVKVENKQLLVDKFIPKVTSAMPGSPPPVVPSGVDVDTVRAPLMYALTHHLSDFVRCYGLFSFWP